jgi:hypothetical protein|tara:strand:+ start:1878 stop:3074 length:1197 start_codon:yes stop_codon:yes gene_type:complete
MITLGQLKTFMATGTVNQTLQGSSSTLGDIVHWVATDIISAAEFWWNRGSSSFDTVKGQAEYFLSNQVFMDKVWGMFDEDNDKPLIKKDLSWIYSTDATPTEQGDADFWAYVGQAECQALQTNSATLSFVSSNAADTAVDIIVKGVSSGVERYEPIVLDGTNTATATNPLTWDKLKPLSINLEQTVSGVVTGTLTTSTFTISSIAASSTSGDITVTTSAAHGLSVGQTVVQAGASDSAYNGSFTVTAVDSTTTYDVTATFTATDTGTMTQSWTVSEIPPNHLRVLRPHIRLQSVPGTAGDTINYFFYKRASEPVADSDVIDLPDIAFKPLRYGVEEIANFLTGKMQASNNAFEKYRDAKMELILKSERDIAGNEIKNWRESVPFTFRLPETISGSITT